MTHCTCFIIPSDILEKLARDRKLAAKVREAAARTARVSHELRKLRTQAGQLISLSQSMDALAAVAAAPAVTVYDSKRTQVLPGTPVAKAKTSRDATAKRAFAETTDVAKFYKEVFKRNSIDNAGMTMMSSIHYGLNFNNAMWNGSQMIYGDGDGKLFIDFTGGNDVIGHELTHGVTQHTLQLDYENDAGGLNESLSDCFGSMFRQWEAGQDSAQADWLIGSTIMGATAKARGYTCLRNMANPADPGCLAPQPTKYSQVKRGMDPHFSSGPPNLAFSTACKMAGGPSWETVGQVWYAVMTQSGAIPGMTMRNFASRTRKMAKKMFTGNAKVVAAVDAGWKAVGL